MFAVGVMPRFTAEAFAGLLTLNGEFIMKKTAVILAVVMLAVCALAACGSPDYMSWKYGDWERASDADKTNCVRLLSADAIKRSGDAAGASQEEINGVISLFHGISGDELKTVTAALDASWKAMPDKTLADMSGFMDELISGMGMMG